MPGGVVTLLLLEEINNRLAILFGNYTVKFTDVETMHNLYI